MTQRTKNDITKGGTKNNERATKREDHKRRKPQQGRDLTMERPHKKKDHKKGRRIQAKTPFFAVILYVVCTDQNYKPRLDLSHISSLWLDKNKLSFTAIQLGSN